MTDTMLSNNPGLQNAFNVKELEEKARKQRQQKILYLISAFLTDYGYLNTAESLRVEAALSKDVRVCDNVDLDAIVLDYTYSYYSKYNKYPKIFEKVEQATMENVEKSNIAKHKKKALEKKATKNISDVESNTAHSCEDLSVNLVVSQISVDQSKEQQNNKNIVEESLILNQNSLKPIAGLYPVNSEWYEIAKQTSMEAVSQKLNVHWDDIVGLSEQKQILKDIFIYPLKYPDLFTGKFSPIKGVLLHGLPGTGKTMLAKAVATECKCTFFNITSSSIVSKWRGDSEKYVRVLFELAQYYAPTVIFIDEIDWMSYTSDSEPAKRFRAELLTRLDGLLSDDNSNVMILSATNNLSAIDPALLRRLGKRVLVDLPDISCRRNILAQYVSRNLFYDEKMKSVFERTLNFSCADLILLCKEAWRLEVQEKIKNLENKKSFETISLKKEISDINRMYTALDNILIDKGKTSNPPTTQTQTFSSNSTYWK